MRRILILMFLLVPILAYSQQDPIGSRKLLVFYSPTCHRCVEVKNLVMPGIEKEFRDEIKTEYRDISNIDNYKLLLSLQEEYKVKIKNILPIFFLEGHFLDAKGGTYWGLRSFITKTSKRKAIQEFKLPSIDLVERFRSFESLAVIGAGLIDGINPCAFTVLVFFISFLALQGYRKRELIPIGLIFISAVFLTYCLIGLGLFGFLYQLRGFWLVFKIVNSLIGIFSIVLGILAIYDFLKFKRTKDTEGLILQLPKKIKDRIHSVIGLRYRSPKAKEENTSKRNIFQLLLGTLITGILVSILEAVCTGQVYLPTIVFVLKTTPLKIQALGYLLLYNLMFILPLLIIFVFALLGATSEQFARFLKKNLGLVKILMAFLFFSLGIVLLAYSLVPAQQTEQTTNADHFFWDFGQVEQGKILQHTFILKNESGKVLNIKGTNTSCGCTVSKLSKKILSPGESTTIDVRFNSKGYFGPVQQFIYVNTDSLDNPVLKYTIKAEVVK